MSNLTHICVPPNGFQFHLLPHWPLLLHAEHRLLNGEGFAQDSIALFKGWVEDVGHSRS